MRVNEWERKNCMYNGKLLENFCSPSTFSIALAHDDSGEYDANELFKHIVIYFCSISKFMAKRKLAQNFWMWMQNTDYIFGFESIYILHDEKRQRKREILELNQKSRRDYSGDERLNENVVIIAVEFMQVRMKSWCGNMVIAVVVVVSKRDSDAGFFIRFIISLSSQMYFLCIFIVWTETNFSE